MSARELTPLGELLERARQEVLHISGREAARRAGITEARWRQVVTGIQTRAGGVRVPVNPKAVTVVGMALAVTVPPEEALKAAGIKASPEAVAVLIEEAKAAAISRGGDAELDDDLAAEIERIRQLPMSAKARLRMMTALIETYQEAAAEEAARHGNQPPGTLRQTEQR